MQRNYDTTYHILLRRPGAPPGAATTASVCDGAAGPGRDLGVIWVLLSSVVTSVADIQVRHLGPLYDAQALK